VANVRLKNITKRFGSVTAVNNVCLDIPHGKVTALLGPSGCGKTTILLMLAGIYKPTEGEIYFDDLQVNGIPPQLRNVGLVFQSYALYPLMTAFENIAFPLKLKKLPKAEIQKRVEEIAEVVQIGDLLDRKPGQMSGGQQQRVGIARAFVGKPKIVFADEPTGNLDSKTTIEVMNIMIGFARRYNQTIVLVTHEPELAKYADRLLTIIDGNIVSDVENISIYQPNGTGEQSNEEEASDAEAQSIDATLEQPQANQA